MTRRYPVLTVADTMNMPILTAPKTQSETGLYVIFMIDRNITVNGTHTTLLHWFEPNLMATDNILNEDIKTKNATIAVGASYITPTPPAGSGPHEYTMLLFDQPPNFSVPADFNKINPPETTQARIDFNLTEFMSQSRLAAPIAANWFQVLNGTAAETSSVSASIAAVTSAMTTGGSMSSSVGASTITASVSGKTIIGTVTSASATASPTGSNGAVEVRSGLRELVLGLGMAVVGAAIWIA